jgi:hypothetical protein
MTIHEYMIARRDGRRLFGYFSTEDAARAAIAPSADTLTGAWRGLNPLRSDSPLVVTLNAPMHPSQHRAGAKDIQHRAALLLDFDADCESDEMSTDAEHEAAIRQAGESSAWLVSLGWPRPTQIDSGRGSQLHVPVDLPADSGADALVRDLLRAIKSRYRLIDEKMHDRPRLARLPGFWNRKSAASTAARPWRMAKLMDSGGDMGANVTHAQIEAVIARIGLPALPAYAGTEKPDPDAVDRAIRQIAEWLDKIGVMLTEIEPLADGRTLLRLSHCPLFDSHRGSSAGIGVSVSGRPLNMCRHTSCGMRWAEWLAAVEKQHGVKLQIGRRLIFKKTGAK